MSRERGVHRRAYVDHAAIAANAAATGASLADSIADVRADAFGHGLSAVARTLAELGVRRFVVSRPADAEVLRSAGLVPLLGAGDGEHPLLGPELYGLAPTRPTRAVLRLEGEIIAVKRVPADRGVSYGYTYRTPAPTTLVLIALGYADGILRAASNAAPVRVGTRTAPITGRIAMDQFMVAVGDDAPRLGDAATLFGDSGAGDPTVVEWADILAVPAPVITSRLGRRIERIHLT
jgi:alanine racemase